MYYLRLVWRFTVACAQNELAHRANFWISLLHSLLNLSTGLLGIVVLFGQFETVRGWDLASTSVLLGVYLTFCALQGLFIGPSLDTLAGMGGEVWTGQFDYTLLRPVDVQFLASLRQWRPLALIDLVLGLAVLGAGAIQLGHSLTISRMVIFLIAMGAGTTILYAILLACTALVFWSPGFMFTWVFNSVFQTARYPLGLYPGWVRLLLTWVVPVGVITTVPAQALTGDLPPGLLRGSVGLAVVFFAGASMLFRVGLRRYSSASS